MLSEPILRPRSDAPKWPTLLQLARLRCAMSPTYALRPWCESSCVYTRMKRPFLLRGPRPPSEHAARGVFAPGPNKFRNCLKPPYEHRLPCTILPPIRTHHQEVDHSTDQNNEPPDLGVSPALLLAVASCVCIAPLSSHRVRVARGNCAVWVKIHTALVAPLV